ncbi:MAG: hypothetical protein WC686_00010 [Candidatus Shapirobacteria bacterium]|jgi:cell division septation protein DedD
MTNTKWRQVIICLLGLAAVWGQMEDGKKMVSKVRAETTVLLAEWNFEDQNQAADGGIDDNLGKMIAREEGFGLSYTYSSGDEGTGDYAVSTSSWAGDAETKYWQIPLSTLGYKDLKVSAKSRSSTTGPHEFRVEYSTDNGANWHNVPMGILSLVADAWNTTSINTLGLPAECENKQLILVRWLATVGASSTAGTNRIDDIRITGQLMPSDTPTLTPSATMTPTESPTQTPTPTLTPAPTSTQTPTPSQTPTPTEAPTPTTTPSASPTITPIPVEKGSIAGFVYFDRNRNQKWDGWAKAEFRLNGWQIFIDSNSNKKRDGGEKMVTTKGSGWSTMGRFKFENLEPGRYLVCEKVQRGWSSTFEGSDNCKYATLEEDHEEIVNMYFGNKIDGKRAVRWSVVDAFLK